MCNCAEPCSNCKTNGWDDGATWLASCTYSWPFPPDLLTSCIYVIPEEQVKVIKVELDYGSHAFASEITNYTLEDLNACCGDDPEEVWRVTFGYAPVGWLGSLGDFDGF